MNTVTVTINDMSSQDLSHELNISLTGIKGGAELLDMSGLSQEQQDELTMIKESSQRLEKIIIKILNNTKEIVSPQRIDQVSTHTQFFRLVI